MHTCTDLSPYCSPSKASGIEQLRNWNCCSTMRLSIDIQSRIVQGQCGFSSRRQLLHPGCQRILWRSVQFRQLSVDGIRGKSGSGERLFLIGN